MSIEKEYNEYYKSLHSNGLKTLRDTKIGIWGHFSCDIYYQLFKKIDLQNYKTFIDLGSGDGKVALIASLFTKSSGIEYDEELFNTSTKIRDKLNLNCTLIKQDFLKTNLTKHDLVFINPDKGFHEKIEEKLIKEINGTLLVANDIFLPRFLKKGKTQWIKQIPFTKYTNQYKK